MRLGSCAAVGIAAHPSLLTTNSDCGTYVRPPAWTAPLPSRLAARSARRTRLCLSTRGRFMQPAVRPHEGGKEWHAADCDGARARAERPLSSSLIELTDVEAEEQAPHL